MKNESFKERGMSTLYVSMFTQLFG